MHPTVERAVERYLAQVDRLLPGLVTGFYVVGSTAYDAYRDGRSDIDFVAVVDDDLTPAQLRRLRIQHQQSGMHTALSALGRRRSPTTGTCNGVFIRSTDLSQPVSAITPVAHHVGVSFGTGPAGSDVSPVAWKTLAERGIPVRGPDPSTLGLDPQLELLRSWNHGNLESYWRPWAGRVHRSPRRWFTGRPRYWTAWGTLGPPRLHCTMATGEVVSKEAAGEYALDVFPSRWHPLIIDALAYVRSQPDQLRWSPAQRGRRTADFVDEVIASGTDLP
ncbi:MAG TPA: aminoglycoside adenylyltransferase domain-containing protein [Acidimicrobiales bacterium]|nr:aminoglycoside adenylyltransferase domain-containing protein [Acidimicrobiales bacterium]